MNKPSIQGRREGGGGWGAASIARLGKYSENWRSIRKSKISQMNAKMTAFKNIVQCYKSNSLLIKENRKNSYFANDKTRHYAENMSFFGNLDNVLKL